MHIWSNNTEIQHKIIILKRVSNAHVVGFIGITNLEAIYAIIMEVGGKTLAHRTGRQANEREKSLN